MKVQNKRIVLTGATGGIGQAIAKALSEQGAILILTGRNTQKLETLNNALNNQHMIVQADLRFTEGREHLFNICREFPSLDGLINNAGISQFSLMNEMTDEDVENLMQTNLVSPMLITGKLLPLLEKSKEPLIVNIGSSFGSIGFPGFGAYCASKFGLRGFTESLSRELGDTKVKTLYLAPRATQTGINSSQVDEMNKALGNQVDSPEVVAKALLEQINNCDKRKYLGFPEKLFVRINSLLPSVVDKALIKQLPTIRQYAQRERIESTIIEAAPVKARA